MGWDFKHHINLYLALTGIALSVGGPIAGLFSPTEHEWVRQLLIWTTVLGFGLFMLALLFQIIHAVIERKNNDRLFSAPGYALERADNIDAQWIQQRAADVFGAQNVTTLAQLNDIRDQYKPAYKVLWYKTDKGGERRGYFCAFPISKSVVEAINNGTFRAATLKHDDVVSISSKSEGFYVGAIYAASARDRAALLFLVRQEIGNLKRTPTRRVYARAFSKDGLRLVSGNGFTPIQANKMGLGDFFFTQLPKR